jgi:hypothetical protein
MRTRWFADPAEGERLDEWLLRLVGAVSRMLDGLPSPAVAPGTGLVDAAASAVVLPHAGVPGCSLVVQVAEWSSSVGCWWSVGTDPRSGPVALELSAELPLRPDGLARAVAWLERELRRPVAARARSYGVVRRREWAVVMDDGYELPVQQRWLPGWRDLDEGGAVPGGVRSEAATWLLGAALAAAVTGWTLAAVTPELLDQGWLNGAVLALEVGAYAALLAWFRIAARGRPGRVRAAMLAGLALATLAAGLAFLPGSVDPPSTTDPAGRALGLALGATLPALLGVAALGGYLVAFLALPVPASPRRPWPRALPVAAGLAWGIDLAVGLAWLARVEPTGPGEAVPVWYGALGSAVRAAGVGLAIVLVFVVLDRHPSLSPRAVRAGLAGGALLILAWSVTLQLATSPLFILLPQTLAIALFSAQVILAGFAGTALLAAAAAEPAPRPPATDEGGADRAPVTAG